jgi:hypothetical protein
VLRGPHTWSQVLLHFLAAVSLERDFAAGDGRAKRDLKILSLRRDDRKSKTTKRENWPQKRPFYQRAIVAGFGRLRGRCHQGEPGTRRLSC